MKSIEWSKLGFEYIPTACHIEYKNINGKWDRGRLVKDPYISLSIAAECLHYGQAAFEGLKVYRCQDGKVRVFRDIENAKRMISSANYACMTPFTEEMFVDAVNKVVTANIDYLPPYGTGGSLYLRPLIIGSGPKIGIAPSDEYIFLILATPVGPYYKEGLKGVNALIFEDYDRAAPYGAGRYKLAGNYAASLKAAKIAKEKGYPVVLYLDSKEHKYFDEFTSSNFFAVTNTGEYITPESKSILPSITNMSLIDLANHIGIKATRRSIEFNEIDNFSEVGACGTAVVITPINKITREDKSYHFNSEKGPVIQKLYNALVNIQLGRAPDPFGWMRLIE
ncbi:MAG TPA: branched chain amino acid aminotransferase [Lentisphaeria bacterium]|nr:MAG: branched chain amino acid aminotransferase [Lentisphaerae bacterium GWF2_38_69]HBM17541.1 branched chain amino acid aminotransferase [Lentisphaeria bacterium]